MDAEGFLGGGAFGKVWKATRVAGQEQHDVADQHDRLGPQLNAEVIAVKIFRVKNASGLKGIVSCAQARKEIQMYSRAQYYVPGVVAVLAATHVAHGKQEGPVTVHNTWLAKPGTHGIVRGGGRRGYVLIANELASAQLMKWTKRVNGKGVGLLTGLVRQGADAAAEHTRVSVRQGADAAAEHTVPLLLRGDGFCRPGDATAMSKQEVHELMVKGAVARMLRHLQLQHKHGIVHVDLKLENVCLGLLTSDLRLLDYGFAVPLADEEGTTNAKGTGTTGYKDPDAEAPGVSAKSDVYAVGWMMLLLLGCIEHPAIGDYADVTKLIKTLTAVSVADRAQQHQTRVQEFFKELQQHEVSAGGANYGRLACFLCAHGTWCDATWDGGAAANWPSPLAADLAISLMRDSTSDRISIDDALRHDWFDNAAHSRTGLTGDLSDAIFGAAVKYCDEAARSDVSGGAAGGAPSGAASDAAGGAAGGDAASGAACNVV